MSAPFTNITWHGHKYGQIMNWWMAHKTGVILVTGRRDSQQPWEVRQWESGHTIQSWMRQPVVATLPTLKEAKAYAEVLIKLGAA